VYTVTERAVLPRRQVPRGALLRSVCPVPNDTRTVFHLPEGDAMSGLTGVDYAPPPSSVGAAVSRRVPGLAFGTAVTGVLWVSAVGFAVTELAGGTAGSGRTLAWLCLATSVVAAVVGALWWRTVRAELAAARTTGADAGSERLRRAMKLVARSSVALSAGRTGIHDVSEQMSGMVESTAGRAVGAVDTTERVSDSIRAVADSADQLTAAISSAAAHAGEVLQITDSAIGQARHAATTIATLRDSSQQIEHVVGLITTIAGQTRMLALNATIEAARAGQAGRGFAVVADEVRALAQATSEATTDVTRSVLAIQSGSNEAQSAISAIVDTIEGIAGSQTAIAAAVEEQATTTNEIQRCAQDAALGADDIVGSIRSLADAARVSAASGAQIRTTSGELAEIGKDLETVLDGYDVAELLAELARESPEVIAPVAEVRNGVTYVEDYVKGQGNAQFEYTGSWCHSGANAETSGTNTYNITPDDVAKVRFTGTKVRFYAVTGPNHGIGAVAVDNGPEQMVDMYSADRRAGVKLYESPTLPYGQHVLTIRVTNRWNPQSRYGWVTIDRVEFE
jgi:hypothetical protein